MTIESIPGTHVERLRVPVKLIFGGIVFVVNDCSVVSGRYF